MVRFYSFISLIYHKEYEDPRSIYLNFNLFTLCSSSTSRYYSIICESYIVICRFIVNLSFIRAAKIFSSGYRTTALFTDTVLAIDRAVFLT